MPDKEEAINPPTRQDHRDAAVRLEALRLSVQYATGPNTSSTTEGIINTAKVFHSFLTGAEDSSK